MTFTGYFGVWLTYFSPYLLFTGRHANLSCPEKRLMYDSSVQITLLQKSTSLDEYLLHQASLFFFIAKDMRGFFAFIYDLYPICCKLWRIVLGATVICFVSVNSFDISTEEIEGFSKIALFSVRIDLSFKSFGLPHLIQVTTVPCFQYF